MKKLARMFTLIISFQLMIGCDSIALQNALSGGALSEQVEISGSIASTFKRISNFVMPSAVADDIIVPIKAKVLDPINLINVVQIPVENPLIPQPWSGNGCGPNVRCVAPQATVKLLDVTDIDNPVEIHSQQVVGSSYKMLVDREDIKDVELKVVFEPYNNFSAATQDPRELYLGEISQENIIAKNLNIDSTVESKLISDVKSRFKAQYDQKDQILKEYLKRSALNLSSLGDEQQIKELMVKGNSQAVSLAADFILDQLAGHTSHTNFNASMQQLIAANATQVPSIDDIILLPSNPIGFQVPQDPTEMPLVAPSFTPQPIGATATPQFIPSVIR